MENNNSNENKTVIEYLGGKKLFLIIAGIIMGVFLISSIVTAVTKPKVSGTAATAASSSASEQTATSSEETAVQTAAETVAETEQTESETAEQSETELTEGSDGDNEPEETETGETDESEQTESEQPENNGSATRGQLNAEASAELYLTIMPFSESGLREQLDFDGYDASEIDYAIANCGADWNEQAARQARIYSIGVLSRSEMIEWLEDDGFTTEQAEYGATEAGY